MLKRDLEYLVLRGEYLAEMGVVFAAALAQEETVGNCTEFSGAMELFTELLKKQAKDLQDCFNEITQEKRLLQLTALAKEERKEAHQ